MAYYTGVCNSFDDIKNALKSHCVSNGWVATTDSEGKDVIYKDNLYVMLTTTTSYFGITGRTGINEGSTPGQVGIRDFIVNSYNPTCPGPVQFPVKYFCFTYSDIDEVFFLINYADMYQWVAFGKSNIPLPGTGLWVAGTVGIGTSGIPNFIEITLTGSSSSSSTYGYSTSAALFWNTGVGYYYVTPAANYWLHSGINPTYPWSLAKDNYYSYSPPGIKYLSYHLQSQPNQFNQQSLLLPVLVYHDSATYSGYYTLAAHIQKARHLMINYLDPETIIYHGSEQWMVFPYFRKVYQSPYTFSLSYVDHTGNFGWAIKKEA